VLLFMLPQIFNFAYSCPQLFHFVECPRHRMPRYFRLICRLSSSEEDVIEYSCFHFKKPKGVKDNIGRYMIRFLEFLGLAKITRNDKSEWLYCNNLTLLNLVLFKVGPMNEGTLAWYLCAIQVLGSLVAFFVRYGIVRIIYN
jgi:UDP-N-acetylglucosamine--dolichyl-phosphate N-acetylglucosaminephosphotransferase